MLLRGQFLGKRVCWNPINWLQCLFIPKDLFPSLKICVGHTWIKCAMCGKIQSKQVRCLPIWHCTIDILRLRGMICSIFVLSTKLIVRVFRKENEQKKLILLQLGWKLLEKLEANSTLGKRVWTQLTITVLSTPPIYRIIQTANKKIIWLGFHWRAGPH